MMTGDFGPRSWAGALLRPSWLLALVVGVAAIVAVGFVHPVAYYLPTLRATAESVMMLLVLTAAWLARGYFVHSRRLRDLLLMSAIVTLALVELVSNTLPTALNMHVVSSFAAVGEFGQLVVAALFTAVALTPSSILIGGGRRPVAISVTCSVACVGLVEIAGLLLSAHLLIASNHPATGLGSALHDPLNFTLLLSAAGLFAYAGTEFARQEKLNSGSANGGSTLTLLAGAATLLAGSRLYSLALPVVTPGTITGRDGLRLIAFAFVLAATLRQDRALRSTAIRAAATAERRRVAEDLHDGLAQDLAFIASFGGRIAGELGDEHPVAIAARRALAVSRGAISELSELNAASSREAFESIAHESRERFKIAIAVDAQPDAELAPGARKHVARIVREAIANAARHGGAETVAVTLRRTASGVALRICDDGCGIPDAAVEGLTGGLGLRSMHDRAAALGGDLTVRQRKAGGTELRLLLP